MSLRGKLKQVRKDEAKRKLGAWRKSKVNGVSKGGNIRKGAKETRKGERQYELKWKKNMWGKKEGLKEEKMEREKKVNGERIRKVAKETRKRGERQYELKETSQWGKKNKGRKDGK